VLGELQRFGFCNEVRLREVSERHLPGLAVERPPSAASVELLQPASEQHLRRSLVSCGELLAFRNERFPAAAYVGVIAQIGVSPFCPTALAPVNA